MLVLPYRLRSREHATGDLGVIIRTYNEDVSYGSWYCPNQQFPPTGLIMRTHQPGRRLLGILDERSEVHGALKECNQTE